MKKTFSKFQALIPAALAAAVAALLPGDDEFRGCARYTDVEAGLREAALQVGELGHRVGISTNATTQARAPLAQRLRAVAVPAQRPAGGIRGRA